MSSIRNILLATDFSPGAEAATAVAFEMAQRFAAKLILLHVYPPPAYYTGAFGDAYLLPTDVIEKVRTDAERALKDLHHRAAKEGIQAEPVALEGIAADIIVAVASSHQVGLIVMGTEGRTGLRHFLLGSVAERVVRTAECPVITVRLPTSAKANLLTR
jgi:universal stress protein A